MSCKEYNVLNFILGSQKIVLFIYQILETYNVLMRESDEDLDKIKMK